LFLGLAQFGAIVILQSAGLEVELDCGGLCHDRLFPEKVWENSRFGLN
jgi:hypothetical protein